MIYVKNSKKWIIIILCIFIVFSVLYNHLIILSKYRQYKNISIAVEFNTHAAAAYVAMHFNWFKDYGINVTTFNSYVTGLALANALIRGDVDAAYICLGPALIAYTKGADIVIVCGTHFYGYELVGKTSITSPKDLEGKKVGVCRPGSPTDILLYLIAKKFHLNLENIDIRRGNPPLLVTLLATGQLDAILVPEHWATIATLAGDFHIILRSQDIWPGMVGSVLVVKRDLLEKDPDMVKKLIEITEKGIVYINKYRDQASEIISEELNKMNAIGVNPELLRKTASLVTPEVIKKSMDNLVYDTALNLNSINEYINLLYKLGWIDKFFNATDVVDLRFLGEATK